jgi:hypothetical protein
MSTALELWFDPASDQAIRQLWIRLEHLDIHTPASLTQPRHPPHVTLVAGDGRWTAVADMHDLVRSTSGLVMSLTALGFFPSGVAFLTVAHNERLARLQREINERLADAGETVWAHYGPDIWTPHCTISPSFPCDRLSGAKAEIDSLLPLEVQAIRICAVDVQSAELLADWPIDYRA